MLLNQGANIEARDRQGRTPLHFAVRIGCEAIVEHLLARGANFEARDERGNTPLSITAEKNSNGLERLFNKYGASDPEDFHGLR
jgi:ankyrin repeat protein